MLSAAHAHEIDRKRFYNASLEKFEQLEMPLSLFGKAAAYVFESDAFQAEKRL